MTASEVNKDLREFLDRLDADVRFDEPMSRHTYLGIGGPADVFVAPRSVEALSGLLKAAAESDVQVLPLGGGTNLLVSDGGIEGIVISMALFDEIKIIGEDSDSAMLYAGAGHSLMRLLRFAADKGLAGMEGLAGIPGQLGGAISGNAGAFDQEIKDVLIDISIMHKDGNVTDIRRDAIKFEYRHAELPAGAIVLAAAVRLGKDDPAAVSKRMEGFMKEKKATQPIGQRSAGCVYKNPPGDYAGRLIESAGLKGTKVGGVEVSSLHANFFVNTGEGTATDYVNLMNEVSEKVKAISGVVLEPEIRMVGRC